MLNLVRILFISAHRIKLVWKWVDVLQQYIDLNIRIVHPVEFFH